VIGLVLAAGTGRRLWPHTAGLPKALVPLDDSGLTPLDVILANFAAVGLTDVAVVVGYAADAVRQRKRDFEHRYAVTLDLIPNDRATTWNNCYSLWCARAAFAGHDVLLSNGDTVHPVSVEDALLAGRDDAEPRILLAVDTRKRLADEEMKVAWSPESGVTRITKLMSPGEAYAEYIGVARIDAGAGPSLVDALESTWRRDPSLYYEDAFAELIERDVRVDVQPIGDVPWIEIDDTADLLVATRVVQAITDSGREPQCRS
jgi:choline kinase